MARPIKFPGCNGELARPPNLDEHQCQSLPLFRNGVNCVSAWQLDDEELAELKRNGGVVFISLWSGKTQPAVYVGTERTVRTQIADNGVWKKGE